MNRSLALLTLAVILLVASPLAQAETIFALATDNSLLSFDSGSPGKTTRIGTISGLIPGESVVGIDFRPATGQLYSLSLAPVGPTFFGRLSIIDPVTAAATPLGGRLDPGVVTGNAYGINFDPVADVLRVVSDAGRNLRVSPVTGQVLNVDAALAYAPGDSHFGVNPKVVGIAYTNSFVGATATRLFGVDSSLDNLVAQDPPDGGLLHTVGPLGFNTSATAGLDISGATGVAYAALNADIGVFLSGLYTIDLSNGSAKLVGTIGSGGPLIRGIAVAAAAPVPEPASWALVVAAMLGFLVCARGRNYIAWARG